MSNPGDTVDYRLSGAEKERYHRDGYLVRPSQFTEVELERLRDGAERAAALAVQRSQAGRTYLLDGKRFVDIDHVTVQFEHQPQSSTVRVIEPVHQFDSQLEKLIDDPRIVDPVADILGETRIALWTNKLNLKRPRTGSGFGWHQDSPYWLHDCNHVDQLPNVFLNFDEATEDNGCLRIVPASHQHGALPGTDDGSQLGGFFTAPDCVDESNQVALCVPAGSLVFFSPHAIHGSMPNSSASPRRAIILTYQPADNPTLKSGEVRNVVRNETTAV